MPTEKFSAHKQRGTSVSTSPGFLSRNPESSKFIKNNQPVVDFSFSGKLELKWGQAKRGQTTISLFSLREEDRAYVTTAGGCRGGRRRCRYERAEYLQGVQTRRPVPAHQPGRCLYPFPGDIPPWYLAVKIYGRQSGCHGR